MRRSSFLVPISSFLPPIPFLLVPLLAVPLIGAALLLHRGSGGLPAPRGTLYVANLRSSDVSVLDLASGRELQRVPVALDPHELAQAGGAVWVSDYRSAAVTRLP